MPKIGSSDKPKQSPSPSRKRSAEFSKHVRAYVFHGVNLAEKPGDKHATGDCPFCGREGKFSVVVETGLWRCLICGEGSEKGGGNIYTFLRVLHAKSMEKATDYSRLRTSRELLFDDTLKAWGVVESLIDRTWLLPGYNPEGKLSQMYRYVLDRESGKHRLLATPELAHGLHGVNLFQAKKGETYLCEGPWDAMALWETIRKAKIGTTSLELTGSEAASLYANINVLAVPGCNVFQDGWTKLFAGSCVTLLYDSDHPKEVNGKPTESVGYAGMRRVAGRLGAGEERPEEIRYLSWGENGYAPDLPTGFDIRDHLSQGAGLKERIGFLESLLEKLEGIPEGWLGAKKTNRGEVGDIDCLPCEDWKELIKAWRKAMKWTEGLDRALSVMLACITSTRAVGDQLWAKVVGPPACGKSTLCEALSVNKKYIVAKSTLRGFHSGYQTDAGGEEDHSLVAKLFNKTLVTKDGDTLLQSPNVKQILSEARDVYDRTSRTSYRNKSSRSYEGINMTWLLCGTSSLRELDSSELGERFLDCVIMETIDDDLEDEILLRKAHQAERALAFEADGTIETQNDPDMTLAMRLTGGYVSFLRENARDLLAEVTIPDPSLRRCIQLGKFVAYMRARPSKSQEEKAEREFATRLVSQLVRLSKCLAVVLNRKTVDEEVLRRVTRVALDTARGRTLEIARWLYEAGEEGLDHKPLAMYTNQEAPKELDLLRFLRRIGAVETFSRKINGVLSTTPRWRLTPKLRDLYQEVMTDGTK